MLVIQPLFIYDEDGAIVSFILPIEFFELELREQRIILKEIAGHIELHNKLH